jgi:hypothetical protein
VRAAGRRHRGQCRTVLQSVTQNRHLARAEFVEHPFEGFGGEPRRRQRWRAGKQFEQQAPERVHVGPCVGVRFPIELLRGHVLRGAQNRSARGLRAARQRPAPDRFCQPEVDHLGNRSPVRFRHQNVVRLQVAVHDSLVVRVLNGRAHAPEQVEPLADGQPVLVAVARNRYPVNQLECDERPPGVGGARVPHAGNVRVIHEGQRVALALEPNGTLAVPPAPEQLERDPPPHRHHLFGQPHEARGPRPDRREKLVAPVDHRPDPFVGAGRGGRGAAHRGHVEEIARAIVRPEQPLHSVAQVRVRTLEVQNRRSRRFRLGLHRTGENAFHQFQRECVLRGVHAPNPNGEEPSRDVPFAYWLCHNRTERALPSYPLAV